MRRLHPLLLLPLFLFLTSLSLIAFIFVGTASAALDPGVSCTADKLVATGQKTSNLLTCHAEATETGVEANTACVSKAEDTFMTAFLNAEKKARKQGGQCSTEGNAETIEATVDAFVIEVTTMLRPSRAASQCAAAKLDAVGDATLSFFQAYASNLKKPDSGILDTKIADARSALTQAVATAESLQNGNCLTTGDRAPIEAKVDGLVHGVISALGTFADMVLKKETIPNLPVPVTLNGKIQVSPEGMATGEVAATYGQGGNATIIADGANLTVKVGAHVLSLTTDLHSVILDGVSLSVNDAIQTFGTDVSSTLDPSQWSPVGQATLALFALTSTDVWVYNGLVARRLDGSEASAPLSNAFTVSSALSAAVSFNRLDWCKALAFVAGAGEITNSGGGCGRAVAACVAGVVTAQAWGTLVSCANALYICSQAVLGDSSQEDLFNTVYDACTAKCGFIPCANNNVCNGVEWCDPQIGLCQRGTDLACPGNGPDSCGWCESHTGCVVSGCKLTTSCAGSNVCDPFAGCETNPPVSCDSPDKCSTSICNPTPGAAGVDANGCVSTPKSCQEGQSCNPDTGSCEAPPDLCAGAQCAPGNACDPSDGVCKAEKCVGVTCSAEEVCVPQTGACIDPNKNCCLCPNPSFDPNEDPQDPIFCLAPLTSPTGQECITGDVCPTGQPGAGGVKCIVYSVDYPDCP